MAAFELLWPTFFPAALDCFAGHLAWGRFFLFQPLGVAVAAGFGHLAILATGCLRAALCFGPTGRGVRPCGPLVQVIYLPVVNLFESVYALS